MKQEAPFSLHLEPVEGCSLACSFCALQSVRDNGADWRTGKHGVNSAPYRFAEVALFERLADEVKRLKWNPRIEIDGRGEPTVHPKLEQIVHAMRTRLPKHSITLTTNGSGMLTVDKAVALLKAGVNTLAVDDYNHAKWQEKLRAVLNDLGALGYDVFKYPADRRGNPHQRFFKKRVVWISDISENIKGTHQLTNQGGNSGTAEAVQQRCAKPFRELNVRWDGNVAICCDDWKGQYKIANVNNTPLDAVWNHPHFEAARHALYAGERSAIQVCSGCNVRTYRNGLLPDKFGKEVMPALNESGRRDIGLAQRGKVFSIKEAK